MLFLFSLFLNAFLLFNLINNNNTTYTEQEEKFIGLGTINIMNNEEFKKIEANENIKTIIPIINKKQGMVIPMTYSVKVNTDKKSYTFTCNDESCSKVILTENNL